MSRELWIRVVKAHNQISRKRKDLKWDMQVYTVRGIRPKKNGWKQPNTFISLLVSKLNFNIKVKMKSSQDLTYGLQVNTVFGLVQKLKYDCEVFFKGWSSEWNIVIWYQFHEERSREIRVLNKLPQKLENNIKPLYGIQRSLSVFATTGQQA